MAIVSVMPSNHLILCCPLLLLPSIFPNIRVFSKESALCIRWPKYWSLSFNISPYSEHLGLISFRMDWLDLLVVQGTLKSLLQHPVQKHQFFSTQLSSESNFHIHTWPLEKPLCSIPGLGRFPGGGQDNPLQYSCLENPMDRGASRATVHGVAKSWTRLNTAQHKTGEDLWDLNLSIGQRHHCTSRPGRSGGTSELLARLNSRQHQWFYRLLSSCDPQKDAGYLFPCLHLCKEQSRKANEMHGTLSEFREVSALQIWAVWSYSCSFYQPWARAMSWKLFNSHVH